MNLLEDWLKQVIKKPAHFLNETYQDEETVRAELEALFSPLVDTGGLEQKKAKAAGHVPDAVLQRLHRKIRNQPCEEALWGGVFWFLANPLPLALAHDLIDRWIATTTMDMTRQVDEVQWRLATFNEYALYTLIRER